MLQVPDSMGGFEALFERRKWEHNSLEAFVSCRRRRKVTSFHSISRIKRCGSEGFERELGVFGAAPLLHVTPRALWFVPWLKVAPRPSPFASHALKLSPAHRCGHFYLSWLNLLGDSGSLTDGSLSSALLHPLQRRCRNICFSTRFRASAASGLADEVSTGIIERAHEWAAYLHSKP